MTKFKYQNWGWCVLACVSLVGCGEGSGDSQKQNSQLMVRYAAMGSKIRHMDPAVVSDTTSAAVVSNIFDRLFEYGYLKRPYALQPALAEAMPEASEDGLVYTIKIRKGVYFHDDECFPDGKGRELMAGDFIYAWKRIADIRSLSSNWGFIEGKIRGLNEFREYTRELSKDQKVDFDKPVEGLEAVDNYTLRITLTQPWPRILSALEHLPFAPVVREAVEHYGDNIINHPVGTGPYMLESWERGSKVVLVRNPKYRPDPYPSEASPELAAKGLLADAGQMMPFLDRVEFAIIEEDQPLWLSFEHGEIDSSGIPKDNFASVISGRELKPEWAAQGITLQIFTDPTTYWLSFNMKDPVVGKSKALRQAISLSLNREDFIDLFINGRGIPARGLLPPNIAGYNPQINSPYQQYDPAKAKELVKQAAIELGGEVPELTLTLGGTDTTARQQAEYLKQAMEQVGLHVRIDLMDWPTLQQQVDNAALQMWPYGWHADYPDAENFFLLYYSKNHAPGPNNSNYTNAEFDKLYEQIVTMPDGPQRLAMIHQAEQLIVNDTPNAFSLHGIAYVLNHPWLKNYEPNPIMWGTLKFQKIDMEMRRKQVGR